MDALCIAFFGGDQPDDLHHHHGGCQGWHTPHVHFGNDAAAQRVFYEGHRLTRSHYLASRPAAAFRQRTFAWASVPYNSVSVQVID
jgi:hypothetical protein